MGRSSSPSVKVGTEVPFHHADRDCIIRVAVTSNADPEAIGSPPEAEGFPVCRATVEPPARGYVDALGWIQLVRSSDAGDAWALDPFEPLAPTSHPFCFFGFAPVFFDAPSRPERADLDWSAAAFLCAVVDERQVAPVGGFSWGFAIRDRKVEIPAPAPIAVAETWDRHRTVLEAAHPSWDFR